MNVSIGDSIPVILKDSDPRHRGPAVKKVSARDRRDRRKRRKGDRDGVVVHLSGKNRERRSAQPDKPKLTY